jgi:hypothetical protein
MRPNSRVLWLVGARFKPKVNEINIVTRLTVEGRSPLWELAAL